MTVNDPVVGFIAMALAIAAILAVGTLIAADIIHIGSHEPRSLTREADAPQPTEQPAETSIEALVPLRGGRPRTGLRPGTHRAT